MPTALLDAPPATTLPPPGYQVRRLLPADAAGVVDCVRKIYGDSYVHPELYDAEAIVRLNASQELVSVVALDDAEQVVGHYALERPGLTAVAEAGEALVLPEHRHHQLMEAMRTLLEALASQLQLHGIYGHAVTNHLFTQRVDERFGEHPCAVSLGWSPRSFHNLAEPLPQRMSELLYFKYLSRPATTTAHVPARHREWCARIYGWLGIELCAASVAAAQPDGTGQLEIVLRADLQRAVVRVRQTGAQTAAEIRSHLQSFRQQATEVVFVELPLAQAATADLCEALEQDGFFFSGIGPGFASDGDVLRLQWLNVPLDLTLIQVQSPTSRELLDYVGAERLRTNRSLKPGASAPRLI